MEEKYSKKEINPNFYSKIEILGLPENKSPRYLSKQEYLNGESGLVLMGKNGIIFWPDRCKEVHLHHMKNN
jgi:hypothetical protein